MITVLMPVYNAEKYLREAIDSVLNQTFKNFEFLIIDDGSNDASVEIIKSYKDSRIRLIHNETNLGISYTLNRGIYLSTFDLIARMDADDISHQQRLEKQYKYALKYSDYSLFSSWVRIINDDGNFKKISGSKCEDLYYSLLFDPAGIYHPSVLYKKSAVLNVGSYTKDYAEDFNLWSKMIRQYKLMIIPEPLVDYRVSQTSLWRVTKKKEYEDAHDQQVIENIHYYTNNSCEVSKSEARFLRGNFKDLNFLHDQKKLVAIFRKLDKINLSFFQEKNIHNTSLVRRKKTASQYKLKLFKKLRRLLKSRELISLLLKLKYWDVLFTFISRR